MPNLNTLMNQFSCAVEQHFLANESAVSFNVLYKKNAAAIPGLIKIQGHIAELDLVTFCSPRELVQILKTISAEDYSKEEYRFIREDDPKFNKLFLFCADHLLSHLMEYCLLRGVNIFARNQFGQNAVHLIAGDEQYAEHKMRHAMLIRLLEWSKESSGRLVNAKDLQGNTPLFFAAAQGNNQIVDTLLQHGAKPQEKNAHDYTPFRAMIQAGTVENIKNLPLEDGPELYKDWDGRTYFHTAVKKRNANLVTHLLESPLAPAYLVQRTNRDGSTPLIAAVQSKLHHFAIPFIENMSIGELTRKADGGNNALHWAAIRTSLSIVEAIVKKYPLIVDSLNYLRRNALHCVVMFLYAGRRDVSKQKEIIQYLNGWGININQKDAQGQTPLHLAIQAAEKSRELIGTVETLLSLSEIKIHVKDVRGRTPLHYAAEAGLEEIVKELVRQGAEVNEKDLQGKTPLHCMMENEPRSKDAMLQAVNMVSYLKRKGADINAQDENGDTPLHYAGLAIYVKTLVKAGADTTIRNKEGKLPAERADEQEQAQSNSYQEGIQIRKQVLHPKILSAAIQKNIMHYIFNGIIPHKNEEFKVFRKEIGQLDKFEECKALHILKTCFEPSEGKELKIKKYNVGQVFLNAIENRFLVLLKYLIAMKANVSANNLFNQNCIHLAVQPVKEKSKDGEAEETDLDMRCFLKKLWKILEENLTAHDRWRLLNQADNAGNTPLHYASLYGKVIVAEFLVEKGARIAVRNYNGQTPASLAIKKGYSELVKFYGDRNEDPNADGFSAIHYAAQSSNPQVIKNIFSHGSAASFNMPTSKENGGFTPLHLLIQSSEKRKNNFELIKYALKKEADPMHCDAEGRNLFHWAAWSLYDQEQYQILNYLMCQYPDVIFSRDNRERNIFHYLAMKSEKRMPHQKGDALNNLIIDLIFDGADINAIDNKTGETPLHSAISGRDAVMALSIIKNGGSIDLNQGDFAEKTPLHYAIIYKQWAVFKELLAQKTIKPEVTDKTGRTLMHEAAELEEGGEYFIALLDKKMINIPDQNGNLPLHNSGNPYDTDFMLKNNGNASQKNKEGKTTAQTNYNNGNYESALILACLDSDANGEIIDDIIGEQRRALTTVFTDYFARKLLYSQPQKLSLKQIEKTQHEKRSDAEEKIFIQIAAQNLFINAYCAHTEGDAEKIQKTIKAVKLFFYFGLLGILSVEYKIKTGREHELIQKAEEMFGEFLKNWAESGVNSFLRRGEPSGNIYFQEMNQKYSSGINVQQFASEWDTLCVNDKIIVLRALFVEKYCQDNKKYSPHLMEMGEKYIVEARDLAKKWRLLLWEKYFEGLIVRLSYSLPSVEKKSNQEGKVLYRDASCNAEKTAILLDAVKEAANDFMLTQRQSSSSVCLLYPAMGILQGEARSIPKIKTLQELREKLVYLNQHDHVKKHALFEKIVEAAAVCIPEDTSHYNVNELYEKVLFNMDNMVTVTRANYDRMPKYR